MTRKQLELSAKAAFEVHHGDECAWADMPIQVKLEWRKIARAVLATQKPRKDRLNPIHKQAMASAVLALENVLLCYPRPCGYCRTRINRALAQLEGCPALRKLVSAAKKGST